MSLPTDSKARKRIPIYSGVIRYFPRSLIALAQCSQAGNDQHNPGKPLHWDRTKSMDHLDCLMRHMVDDVLGTTLDTDDIIHKTKVAWRAMADLELALEAAQATDVAEDATGTNSGTN